MWLSIVTDGSFAARSGEGSLSKRCRSCIPSQFDCVERREMSLFAAYESPGWEVEVNIEAEGAPEFGEVFYSELRVLDTTFLVAAVPARAATADRDIESVLEDIFGGYDVERVSSVEHAVSSIATLVEIERILVIAEEPSVTSDLYNLLLFPDIEFPLARTVANEFFKRARVVTEQSPLDVYNITSLIESGIYGGALYFVKHELNAFLVMKAAGSWLVIECARGFGLGLRNKSQELIETLLSIPISKLRKRVTPPGFSEPTSNVDTADDDQRVDEIGSVEIDEPQDEIERGPQL
uniref:Uncharacterized protein n=1 Tax=mine drainage metagenome TaxID=410659 RepID=E6Q5R2_9ZZZZ